MKGKAARKAELAERRKLEKDYEEAEREGVGAEECGQVVRVFCFFLV